MRGVKANAILGFWLIQNFQRLGAGAGGGYKQTQFQYFANPKYRRLGAGAGGGYKQMHFHGFSKSNISEARGWGGWEGICTFNFFLYPRLRRLAAGAGGRCNPMFAVGGTAVGKTVLESIMHHFIVCFRWTCFFGGRW